jgi:hypothetical protein
LPIGRFTDAGRRALGADASGANLLRDTSVDFDQIDFLRVTMNGYEATREAAMAAFAKDWRREEFYDWEVGSAFGGKPENICSF